ncbi:MAG: hypothetical protein HY243_16475 [Proteobacteria bacterium]|nr:hypothetical protein [Pseudomonadota bacterium]
MRIGKWAAAVAIVCSGIVANMAAAGATTDATASNCRDAARQVKTALASNAQSPNYSAATKEKNNGASFCVHEMYADGVAHYDNALKLLGASKSSQASAN